MTYGDRGNKQTPIPQIALRKKREKEDREAMRILGIANEDNIYLGLGDGEIEHDLPTIGKVAREIRVFKPEIIITTNPQDYIIRFAKDINWINHRDHRHCGRIVLDAAYPYARDLLFFPEHFKDSQAGSWACTEFLFTDVYDHPDLVYIDVTDYIDYRTKALAAHSSQYSLKQVQESTDFFTKDKNGKEYPGGRRYDRFRYCIAD